MDMSLSSHTTSKSLSPHFEWVDLAKGICIIFVVMMHATLGIGEITGREGFMHTVVAFARPFRMPDFFLISGLFLSRVIDRDWRTYSDKRIVHFVYFYLLWMVIQSAFKYGQVSNGSVLGFLEHLAWGLIEPYSTLWFIYILAIFSVVTKLLRGLPPIYALAGAALLEIAPIHTNWFLFDEFCSRYVYFLGGYLFAPLIFQLAEWVKRNKAIALSGLILWGVINGVLALTPVSDVIPSLEMPYKIAELPFVSLLLGVLGAMAIVTSASLLSEVKLSRLLVYCGSHSIAIYLAFFLPMAASRTLLIKSGLIEDTGIMALIVLIVAIVAPLILERLVRHTPLNFLFKRPAVFHLKLRSKAGQVTFS